MGRCDRSAWLCVDNKGSRPIGKRGIVALELAGIWAQLETSSRLAGAFFGTQALANSNSQLAAMIRCNDPERQESGDGVQRSSPICSGFMSRCAVWQVLSKLRLADDREKGEDRQPWLTKTSSQLAGQLLMEVPGIRNKNSRAVPHWVRGVARKSIQFVDRM